MPWDIMSSHSEMMLKADFGSCQRNRPPVRADQHGAYDVFQVIPTSSRTGFIRVTAEIFLSL